MMYFFWISHCSCMLTVILRLSIQMSLASRALASLDCVASKTKPSKTRTFFFLVPCGIQEKNVKCLFWLYPRIGTYFFASVSSYMIWGFSLF